MENMNESESEQVMSLVVSERDITTDSEHSCNGAGRTTYTAILKGESYQYANTAWLRVNA